MAMQSRQIKLANRVVFSHFTFMPPLVANAVLDNEACFIFPINALGDIYRPDGKHTVRQTEGVLMRCGQYINKWQHIDASKNAEVVLIRLFPAVLDEVLEEQFSITKHAIVSDQPKSQGAVVVSLDQLLQRYLESLMFYFDYPHLVTDEIIRLKVKELILLLLHTQEPNPISDLLQSIFEPQKLGLIDVVHAHLTEQLSIAELASLANMSLATFKRKFKAALGSSPGQYIVQKRLTLAAGRLRQTNESITNIAFDLGYNDANYFSKAFAKAYGQSPRSYRKQYAEA